MTRHRAASSLRSAGVISMPEHSATLVHKSSATLVGVLATRFNDPMEDVDPIVLALRRLCDENGGADEVAQRARISAENVKQILRGVKLPSGQPRGVGRQLRDKITLAFPDWLGLEGHLAAEPRASYSATSDITIPQYATGGAMGFGVLLRDQPGTIQSWRVSPEWVQKNVHHITSPRNLAVVTGFGDSMRPLFNPGDPLLVDRGVTAVDFDGIYFFRIDNEGFIKRLQRIPGVGLRAISENKAYESWDIREGMDFEVFARVVKVWRGEDF